MFATIFLDMKIPREKSLVIFPAPSMPKITEIKNEIFLFSFPLFRIGVARVKTAFVK